MSPASTVQPQCMSPDKLNIQSADHLGPHDLRLEGKFSSSVLWMSVTWGTPCPMLCLMSYTGPKPGGPLGDRGGKHGKWVLPRGSRFPGETTGLTHQCPLSSQDPFQSFKECLCQGWNRLTLPSHCFLSCPWLFWFLRGPSTEFNLFFLSVFFFL